MDKFWQVFSWTKTNGVVSAVVEMFETEEQALRYMARQKGNRLLVTTIEERQMAFRLLGAERAAA